MMLVRCLDDVWTMSGRCLYGAATLLYFQYSHFAMSFTLHNKRPSDFDLSTPFEAIIDGIIADHATNPSALQQVIFLVPTGRRARLLRRRLITQTFERTGKPVVEVPVYTLEQFVRLCSAKLFGNRAPRLLSEGYITALVEEAAEGAERKRLLKFFTSANKGLSPAVLERLTNIILGLKEDGITPAALRTDLEQPTSEVVDAARLADLTALYEEYERLLGEQLCDYPSLLNRINTLLQAYLGIKSASESAPAAQMQLAFDNAGEDWTPEQEQSLQTSISEPSQAFERIDKPTNSLAKRWRELFPTVTMLVADGFTEFKKPEELFLANLYYAPFHVRVTLEYSPTNGPLFGGLDRTLENLQGFRGGELTPEDDPQLPHYTAYSTDGAANERFKHHPEDHLPRTSYLRRWLFNTTDDIRHDGFNDMVNIIGFENRADEARSVAKLIKHLAQHDGVRLADICVVMRQPELYTGLFREMFALYDIPANITDRFALEKSPVVTAVFAVLDMMLLGFRRSDVLRALQSPYLRFTRREGRQDVPLNAANLYTSAERMRISGGNRFGRKGKETWQRRLMSRLELLQKRQALLATDPNADADEYRELLTMLDETELALQDFSALAAMFPDPEAELTAAEFNSLVKEQIIHQLQVRSSIIDFHQHVKHTTRHSTQDLSANGTLSSARSTTLQHTFHTTFQHTFQNTLRLEEEVEKDARAFTALVNVLDEMTAIMQERFGNAKRSAAEFAERLRTATRNSRYQVREKLGYGVTVTTLEQIRGVPFGVTILCGAIDGEFPTRYVPESFLGKTLADTEERFLQSERMQFFQALTNNPLALEAGTKRLFITYPTVQGDTELVRSSFVDALLKVTSLAQHGKVLLVRALRQMPEQATTHDANIHASSTVSSTVSSPHDWQRSLALGIASHDEFIREMGKRYVEALRSTNRSTNRSGNDSANGAAENVFQNIIQSEELVAQGFLDNDVQRQELQRVQEFLRRRWSGQTSTADSLVRVEIPDDERTTTFSISALEQYKKCPYQYFSQRVLKLREVQQFDSSLSPLESGSLLHRILYRFYRAIQSAQIADGTAAAPIKARTAGAPDLVPVRLVREQETEYRTRLQSIAEEEIEHIRFEHPFFALDKEALLGSTEKVGKLDQWLTNELHRVDAGWTHLPALFEFAFGERPAKHALESESEQLATTEPLQIASNLRLRGKIDRIELSQTPTGTTFVIGDYKSGSLANLAANGDIKKGLSLQMPLYAEATRQLLRAVYGIEAEPEGMAYYVLSPKAPEEGKVSRSEKFVLLPATSALAAIAKLTPRNKGEVVTSRDDTERSIEQSVGFASQYAEHIQHGEFPVQPFNEKQSCSYCAYKGVCRVAELRTA